MEDLEVEVVAERLPEHVPDMALRDPDVVREVAEEDVAVKMLQVGDATPAIGAERVGGVVLERTFDDHRFPAAIGLLRTSGASDRLHP